jgi:hypothetical protein
VSRTKALRRQSRGFTLLVALGVVAVVTLAVMLSYRVVGREADTQGESRRHKEAFFAAEAGLAEGREAMRLRIGTSERYNDPQAGTLSGLLGTAVNEAGLGDSNRPWYEVLPGPGTDRWNYLRLTPASMLPAELASSGGEAYVDYPNQDSVRYRVFLRDDPDDNNGNVDFNGQVWLISVGEVVTPNGRPTRAVVQALITNQNVPNVAMVGCLSRGCGPDQTFNNTQDPSAPNTAGGIVNLPASAP